MANKNDYISDNLITIRDRLRESAAAIREENASSDSVRSEAAAAAVPPAGSVRRQEEGMRAKQDLAGRLAQDLARITDQLKASEQRTAALQERQQELQELARTLEALTPLSAQDRFAAEADRLRLEYFRLKGRQEAMSDRFTVSPAPSGGGNGAPGLVRAAWIIAAAVLAGAVIVAGVSAVLFA